MNPPLRVRDENRPLSRRLPKNAVGIRHWRVWLRARRFLVSFGLRRAFVRGPVYSGLFFFDKKSPAAGADRPVLPGQNSADGRPETRCAAPAAAGRDTRAWRRTGARHGRNPGRGGVPLRRQRTSFFLFRPPGQYDKVAGSERPPTGTKSPVVRAGGEQALAPFEQP